MAECIEDCHHSLNLHKERTTIKSQPFLLREFETWKFIEFTKIFIQIVKEATEIQRHPGNFSMKAGFILSRTWQLVISLLKSLQFQRYTAQAKRPLDSSTNQKGCIPPRTQTEWRDTQHTVGHLVIGPGCTQPSAKPWRWGRSQSQKSRRSSRLHPRTFHRILSQRIFQDWEQGICYTFRRNVLHSSRRKKKNVRNKNDSCCASHILSVLTIGDIYNYVRFTAMMNWTVWL